MTTSKRFDFLMTAVVAIDGRRFTMECIKLAFNNLMPSVRSTLLHSDCVESLPDTDCRLMLFPINVDLDTFVGNLITVFNTHKYNYPVSFVCGNANTRLLVDITKTTYSTVEIIDGETEGEAR